MLGFGDGVVEKGDVVGIVSVADGVEKRVADFCSLQFSHKSGRGVVKILQEFSSRRLKVGRRYEWASNLC